MSREPIDIVNLSDLDPDWNWLKDAARGPQALRWTHVSTQTANTPGWLPARASWSRAMAGWQAASALTARSSILVSHGPRMALYGATALAARFMRRKHLAYSFNFTELPHGTLHKAMSVAFRAVDRFVCFSNMERALYAQHFDLDINRIDMIHWAARSPAIDRAAAPAVRGDYLCAIGSQARDYATLLEAMRALPQIRLVIVATPQSVTGLNIPSNVEIRCNIPLGQAMNILQHSRFMVVPLRDSEVPCGHVTIVAAMHLQKATIASASSGIADYVANEETGLTVAAGDPNALSAAIDRLWSDPAHCARLGIAAQSFAAHSCSEAAAVAYFEKYLRGVHDSMQLRHP